MTRAELLENPQVLKVEDIMKIFACSRDMAYKAIREIKAVSDIYGRCGRILVEDFERWKNTPKTKSPAGA